MDDLRKEIDQIDRDLIELLKRRFEKVDKITQLKTQNNTEIYDSQRESEMVAAMERQLATASAKAHVANAFKAILKQSLEYCKSKADKE